MNKYIVSFTLIIALIGCDKTYTYIETTDSAIYGKEVLNPVLIKAKDDSTAFVLACELYNSHKEMAYTRFCEFSGAMLPIEFELFRNKQNIYYEHVAKHYNEISIDLSEVMTNRKVYKDVAFGMSMEKVKSLDHFKNYSWDHYTPYNATEICTDDVIANLNFWLNFEFYKDELYHFAMSPPGGGPEYAYDAEKRLETLKTIFTEAYGKPSYENIYGEFDLESTSPGDFILYKWETWGKVISIVFNRYKDSRSLPGREYRVYATITNPERRELKKSDEQRQAQLKKENERKIAVESASEF